MSQVERIPDLTPFTAASMGMQGPKDRPYSGSLNPIWCEREYAIEHDLTAGEYVKKHIRNWNFSYGFDHLYDYRFQHEFCHVLLGLAFLKMGRNPTQFDFGYDGNYQAEALVIAMERPFNNMFGGHFREASFKKFSEDEYVDDVLKILKLDLGEANKLELRAYENAKKISKTKSLVSRFEARRHYSFDETNLDKGNLFIQFLNISQLHMVGKRHNNNEKIRPVRLLAPANVREIYQTIAPVIRFISKVFEEDKAIQNQTEEYYREQEIMIALKSLHVSDLWCAINNPKGEIELRMTERNSYVNALQELKF